MGSHRTEPPLPSTSQCRLIRSNPVAVVSGPRLLTMFYYVSDVKEGGETAFAGPDPSGRSP
eukprot:scaffold7594_cov41-Attheya_sp.AAC.3